MHVHIQTGQTVGFSNLSVSGFRASITVELRPVRVGTYLFFLITACPNTEELEMETVALLESVEELMTFALSRN